MKKQILTMAILLGLAATSFADPQGGGFLKRGDTPNAFYSNRDGAMPMLPNHNANGNQNADAPLGTGIAVLAGLGAAYACQKKKKSDE